MKSFSKISKGNTALLVIDVINSCAHENCEIPEWNIHFGKVREMVNERLIPFFKKFKEDIGSKVIYTTTVPWQKEYLPENINNLYEDPNVVYYTKDKSGFAEKFYAVTPGKDDLIITKDTNDAFSSDKLIKYANENGIKFFVTTGIFTDGCVMASVMSGFSRGYNFITLSDLVETTDSPTRQDLQKRLLENNFHFLWSRVATSEEFLQSWK